MQNSIFIAQESSQYLGFKKRPSTEISLEQSKWNFAFMKNKYNFRYVFIYKNQHTLCYAIFHENFEVGIYIQKVWYFLVCEVFIYKNPDTSQKARQFALCVTQCFVEFLKLAERGGHLYMQKKCILRYVSIYIKPDTLRYIFIYINNALFVI